MTKSLNEFISAASTEGKLQSAGSFTLNADIASAKLENFQLLDPYLYAAHIVAAACLSNATNITLKKTHNTVAFHFGGEGVSTQDLTTLSTHMLAGAHGNKRLQELAIAMVGAKATGTESITFESWVDGVSSRLVVRDTGREITEEKSIDFGNILTLTYPLTFNRLASVFDKKSPELDVLKRFCSKAPLNVCTENLCISSQKFEPGEFIAWKHWRGMSQKVDVPAPTMPHRYVDSEHWRHRYSLVLALTNPIFAEVQGFSIVLNGVLFRREAKLLDCKFACGVIYIDSLSKNVSHTDLAEDASYQEMLSVVKKQVDVLWEEFAASDTLPAGGLEDLILPYLRARYKKREMPSSVNSYILTTELEKESLKPGRFKELLQRASLMEDSGEREKAKSLRAKVCDSLGRALHKHYVGNHYDELPIYALLRAETLRQLGSEEFVQAQQLFLCLAALEKYVIKTWEPEGEIGCLRWIFYLILTDQESLARDELDRLSFPLGWKNFLKAEFTGDHSLYSEAAKEAGNCGFFWTEAAASLWSVGRFKESFRYLEKANEKGTECDALFLNLMTREARGKVSFMDWVKYSIQAKFYSQPDERLLELERSIVRGKILPKFALDRLRAYSDDKPEKFYLIHRLIWAWRSQDASGESKSRALQLRARFLLRRMLDAESQTLVLYDRLPW